MENINQQIEDIIIEYAYGNCAVFAVALSQKLSLPIVEIYDGEDMVHVALVVASETLKQDRFLDVLGNNSYQNIKKRYEIIGKPNIQQKSLSELRMMTQFTNEDIINAKNDLEFLIEHNNYLEKIKSPTSKIKKPKK